MAHTAKYKPMPMGQINDYGFEEDAAGLVGPQSEAGQNYITVIPVDFSGRRTYNQYDAFSRSTTISREFLLDRQNEFLRSHFNGSADNLDKVTNFYPPNVAPPPPSIPQPLPNLDVPTERRPSNHMVTLNSHSTSMGASHPLSAASVTHPSVPIHQHDSDAEKKTSAKMEIERKKGLVSRIAVDNGPSLSFEICVYLHSKLALKLRLEDGVRVTSQELLAVIAAEEELSLPTEALEVFAIWMVCPLLEIQLKPHHRPLEVRRHWLELLRRYSNSCLDEKAELQSHEPKIVLRRNIFFSKRDEVRIRDPKILELLYEETQWNMRSARYPCELPDYEMLAGIQARLELGPYDHNTHTPSFFRRRLVDYLPEHACRLKFSDFVSFSSKSTPEIRVIEQFRSIPNNVTSRKLVRKYLEFSWTLPYYGSAFFHGQIETPRKGLSMMFPRPDLPVLIAINAMGITLIDPELSTVLLSLRYDELSWDFARPSNERTPHCLPCFFLQFGVVENSRRCSKVLQIFSKQAVMMDALIATFVEELKRRAAQYPDDLEGHMLEHGTDVDGRCVGTMGSWQFNR